MRFVGFWVLVSLILLIVFSSIIGRPVLQLYFRRCCEEDIENDHVIFENLGNNFLRERLISSPDMLQVDEDNYLIADLVNKEPIENQNYNKRFEVKATSKPVVNVHDITSRYKDDALTQKENYESTDEETDDTVGVHIKTNKLTKPYRLQTELIYDNFEEEQSDEIDKDPKEDGNLILIDIASKTEDSSKNNNNLAEPELGQKEELANSENNNDNSNEDEENNVEDNEVLLSSEMSTEGKNIKATTVIR